MSKPLFADRSDAGRQLAQKLLKFRSPNTVVLALPRGGVPVALEIALFLQCSFDIYSVRKLGVPENKEIGFGAVAFGGVIVMDPHTIALMHISQEDLDTVIAEETAEVERRNAIYRGNRHSPRINGKIVIVADDGLATGVTALAALRALRTGAPRSLILAIPVCTRATRHLIEKEADELVCLAEPENLRSVGEWYENFDQLSDDKVMELLRVARAQMAA